MASLQLAPPPPRWVDVVPEQVWMHQLMGGIPGTAPPGTRAASRSAGRKVEGSTKGKASRSSGEPRSAQAQASQSSGVGPGRPAAEYGATRDTSVEASGAPPDLPHHRAPS
mgnify:CR=1 FL=1|jgi:hypothetical protein